VITAGIFIGINNTLTTQAVMMVSPVERPVASAAYGFVRFLGGGLAPFAAGKLVERFNLHVPFVIGAVAETEIPLGEHRWLTVVSPQDPEAPGP
jgi:MFS transporter, ACDE family, multidrug resistance protein